MVGKSSVSALQEYCAKNKIAAPIYQYLDEEDGGFVCEITVMDTSAEGKGRSKRDAKHQAAGNLIKRLRLTDIANIPQMAECNDEIPTTDMIVVLRDYCVKHEIPLPTLEIVQQAGTPDAPEFTALCTIASIRRYGVSENKKDARQKAALEMLRVICNTEGEFEQELQVATLQDKAEEAEEERYRKFKTYRELTESNSNEIPGVLLSDRHNYFTKFYNELKEAAKKVLRDTYETDKDQALEVLKALKIIPKISKQDAVDQIEQLTIIELNCEYDVLFAGTEDTVYTDVVNYFKVML